MSWQTVKLSELCVIEKGNIGITKAIAGEYPLVVTSEDRKSHNEYQFDDEAVIIPLVSSTGHGHKSLKRIHYQEGKFAVGSILCAVIPKDKSILNAHYLYRYLDLNKENELVARMKGMANVTLPMKEIANIEIPLPDIETQFQFVEKINSVEAIKDDLGAEQETQLTHLKLLRQQILTDAMQGKLDVPRPVGENGAELLSRIQAEKAKTVKKVKPLSEIKADDIPFAIPEHWVWCRLNDVCELKSGNQYNYSKSDRGIMFIKVGDMNLNENEYEIKTSTNYFNKDEVKITDLIPLNSVIFPKRGGAIATNKRRAVIQEPILVDSNTMAVTPSEEISFDFFFHWFTTIDLSKLGNEGVIPQVNNKDLNPLLIPLPPLSEQLTIVSKIDSLMALCNELEASVRQNQEYTQMLYQTALREALEG